MRQRLALCWRTMPAEPAHLYLCVLRLGVVQLQVRVGQPKREQPPLQRDEGQVLVMHPGYSLWAVCTQQPCGRCTVSSA